MKKVILGIVIGMSMLAGISFGYVQSEQYNSKSNCMNGKLNNDKLYPSYERSNCYSKDNSYYYNICQKGENCTIDNNQEENSNVNIVNNNSKLGINNLYYIQDKKVPYKEKLDNFLRKLVSLKDTKYKGNKDKYLVLLDGIIGKLNKLEPKYKNNDKITSIISYLADGINLIKDHVKKEEQEKAKENQINKFFCDLQDGCDNKLEAKKSEAETLKNIKIDPDVEKIVKGLHIKATDNLKKVLSIRYLKDNKDLEKFKEWLRPYTSRYVSAKDLKNILSGNNKLNTGISTTSTNGGCTAKYITLHNGTRAYIRATDNNESGTLQGIGFSCKGGKLTITKDPTLNNTSNTNTQGSTNVEKKKCYIDKRESSGRILSYENWLRTEQYCKEECSKVDKSYTCKWGNDIFRKGIVVSMTSRQKMIIYYFKLLFNKKVDISDGGVQWWDKKSGVSNSNLKQALINGAKGNDRKIVCSKGYKPTIAWKCSSIR